MSAVLALVLGSTAAYALVRFQYRPRLGIIGLFIFAIALALVAIALGAPWPVALAGSLAVFLLLAQTMRAPVHAVDGQQRHRLLAHLAAHPAADAVVIPLCAVPAFDLLDTQLALIVTYVATNLPIAVWLMRDYGVAAGRARGVGGGRRGVNVPHLVRSSCRSRCRFVATFLVVLIFRLEQYLVALILSGANSQTMPLLVAAQNATRGRNGGRCVADP